MFKKMNNLNFLIMQLWLCNGPYNWNLFLKIRHRKEENPQQRLLRIITIQKLHFQGNIQLCLKTSPE